MKNEHACRETCELLKSASKVRPLGSSQRNHNLHLHGQGRTIHGTNAKDGPFTQRTHLQYAHECVDNRTGASPQDARLSERQRRQLFEAFHDLSSTNSYAHHNSWRGDYAIDLIYLYENLWLKRLIASSEHTAAPYTA
jgi:hypothetical protein